MAGKASVIFNADTGQYIAAVQGMDAATAKTAQTVADAKNRILASYQAQEVELKKLGSSHEDLSRAATNASNALAKTTERNAEEQIATLDRVMAKQRQAIAEMKAVQSVSDSSPFDEVARRSKASALVQGIGGRASVRAGEAFLSTIPGAETLLNAVFPVAGAAALGMEVVKGVEALHNMYEEAQNVERELSDGWRSVTSPIEQSTDALRKANDELRIADDRLNHRSSSKNELALELDEARIYADKLAESADNADEKLRKLFKEHTVGLKEQLFSGAVPTGGAEDDITKRIDAIQVKEDANRDQTRQNPGDTAGIKARRDELAGMYRELHSFADNSISQTIRNNPESAKDGSLNGYLTEMRGARRYAGDMLDSMDADQDNQNQTAQNKKDQNARDLKRDQDEAARKSQEAARQAAEAQRKQFEDQYTAAQLPFDTATGLPKEKPASPQDLYSLRVQQQSHALPDNKIEAEKNTYEAYKSWLEQSTAETKRIREAADKAERQEWEDQLAVQKAAGPMSAQAEADYWTLAMLEAETGSQNYLDAERKANEAIARVREERKRAAEADAKAGLKDANDQARLQEATVALELQMGQISKYSAAVQLASIHTQQYTAQIENLKETLASSQAEDVAAGRDHSSAETEAAAEAVKDRETQRQIELQKDAAAVYVETWKGALEQVNALWIQNATDSAAQVRQLYSQAIDGFNDQAANALTGGKTNWSGYARGLAKTVATDGLKRAEAPVLGALGLGKPDGSSSNPWYVKVAGGGSAVGEGAMGFLAGFAKLFGKGGSSSGSAGAGGGDTGAAVSSIAEKALGGFADAVSAGGFALGGDVAPSSQARSITMGEMGPEELTLGPGTAAHVTPNKDLGGNSGNVYYSVQVANGVTPEEFNMRMHQALSAYHPQAVKSSVQAMQDAQRRKPSSTR